MSTEEITYGATNCTSSLISHEKSVSISHSYYQKYATFLAEQLGTLAKQTKARPESARPFWVLKMKSSTLTKWPEVVETMCDLQKLVQSETLLHTTLTILTISNAFEILQNCAAEVMFLKR